MKLTRFAALALTFALTAGCAGCSSAPAGQTEGTLPAPVIADTEGSEETLRESEPSVSDSETASFAEKNISEVKDAEGGKLVIWSYDPEFKKILEKYSPVKDYEYVEYPANEYFRRLDAAIATGKAPDIFLCGFDQVKEYAESVNTLSINDIGISNKSCKDMYDYSLRMSCDSSGNIKGLAWELMPSAVFYQRSLAQQYLGSSEPDKVSGYFSTWNAFITAARHVSLESDGSVRIVSGTDDVFKSYMGNRTTAWKTEGKLTIDASCDTYFSFAKAMNSEKLSFDAARGSDVWKAGMRNKTVLSYWGPLSLARSQGFGLDSTRVKKANPTSGDWGIVAAPDAFAWGGSWIMVSSDCDMRKSCADIINALCCDRNNLKEMLSGGMSDFVNSRSVMKEASLDPRYNFAWLGGQNPYTVLASSAEQINVGTIGPDDAKINDIFCRIVNIYVADGLKTVKDAKATFREILIEKKIVSG